MLFIRVEEGQVIDIKSPTFDYTLTVQRINKNGNCIITLNSDNLQHSVDRTIRTETSMQILPNVAAQVKDVRISKSSMVASLGFAAPQSVRIRGRWNTADGNKQQLDALTDQELIALAYESGKTTLEKELALRLESYRMR